MTMLRQDFNMTQGKHKTLQFTIYQSDGETVQDITGATFEWACARSPRDASLVTKTSPNSGVSISDAEAGRVDVALVPGDTEDLEGYYHHELEMTLSGFTDAVAEGRLEIRPSPIS